MTAAQTHGRTPSTRASWSSLHWLVAHVYSAPDPAQTKPRSRTIHAQLHTHAYDRTFRGVTKFHVAVMGNNAQAAVQALLLEGGVQSTSRSSQTGRQPDAPGALFGPLDRSSC